MIQDISPETLPSLRNPAFAEYAGMYVGIYQSFLDQVASFGLAFAPEDDRPQVEARLTRLRELKAIFRNNGKSIYANAISPACVACRKGVGSATFFISLQCHRDCFYCFNPNQEDYEHFQTNQRDLVRELEEVHAQGLTVEHLALTGGEPLLHRDEAIRFFETATRLYPGAHTRLYTCGDHLDQETAVELAAAGLQEVRFSLRMHDTAAGKAHTLERLALAREHFSSVMVEMPVLPGTREEMEDLLRSFDAVGLDSINLLEFCFPLNNAEAFRERGFRLKQRPFLVLYDYWYAGGLPVAGSELLCLDLVAFALEEGLSMGVHYCSLENKHTGQLFQLNANQSLPRTAYFSPRDFFIKTAKVFGEDIPAVQERLDQNGYRHYDFNLQHNYLEFHVDKIRSLKPLDVEVGISYQVLEERQDGIVLRELKVDLTTPRTFNLSKDV